MRSTKTQRRTRPLFKNILLISLLFSLFSFSACSSERSLSAEALVLPTVASTAQPIAITSGTPSNPNAVIDLPATNTPIATTGSAYDPVFFTPTPTATFTQVPRSTATPDVDLTATLIGFPTGEAATATPRATREPNVTPTLRPDDPVFYGTSIDFLTDQIYGTGQFTITRRIGATDDFTRYEFEHESDSQLVEGFFNIPRNIDDSVQQLPVAIVLHGYIPPEEYELLDYTARYADILASNGFIAFHPSYRGHPPRKNSTIDNVFRIEYAIDVLNLMELIRLESADRESVLNLADTTGYHIMGHSMGGGVAQRVMTVRPDEIKSLVLYAPMSGDEGRNYEKIKEWGEGREWRTEFFAPDEVIAQVSPINYVDRWEAPVEIHHGTKDDIVPPEWSDELCQILEAKKHPVACYDYLNYPHNFYGSADQLFVTRMISFFESN
ncbi:MAG: alpha/beta fold hydrolase [Chloroflexota bacterium]